MKMQGGSKRERRMAVFNGKPVSPEAKGEIMYSRRFWTILLKVGSEINHIGCITATTLLSYVTVVQ